MDLRNGSKFYFFHLEREGVANVLRGLEINSAFIDQAEEVESNLVDLLEDRLSRWDKAIIAPEIVTEYERNNRKWPWHTPAGTLLPPNYLILSCNPDTQLHWLWRRYHPDSEEWRNNYRFKGYKLIHFDSRNNKFLSKKNLQSMMGRGDDFVRRNVLGIWGRPQGSIFYIDPKSIIDPTTEILDYIKNECLLYRVLDHGFSAPTCVGWFAADRKGNIICFREYHKRDDKIRNHRENITTLSAGETYTASIADSEIFNMMPMKGGGRYSVASEYGDKILYPATTSLFWSRADKNEMASRSRLIEYLAIDPHHKNIVNSELGAPHLYFVRKTDEYKYGCDNIIKEIQAAKLLKVGEVDGEAIFSDERDPEIRDEGLDVTRYMVMARPMSPGAKQRLLSSRTFDGYSKLASEVNRKRSRLRKLDE